MEDQITIEWNPFETDDDPEEDFEKQKESALKSLGTIIDLYEATRGFMGKDMAKLFVIGTLSKEMEKVKK